MSARTVPWLLPLAAGCAEPALVRVEFAPPPASDRVCELDAGPEVGVVGSNAEPLLYAPGPRCVVFSAVQIRTPTEVHAAVVRTRAIVRETAPGAVPCLGSAGRVLAAGLASREPYVINVGVFQMDATGPRTDETLVVSRGTLGGALDGVTPTVCMEGFTCGALHERTLEVARQGCARAPELPPCYLVRSGEATCMR